jgi:hypothetical protein
LGFCGIAKPSNGKLVLRTGSMALFAKHYETGDYPSRIRRKNKESASF